MALHLWKTNHRLKNPEHTTGERHEKWKEYNKLFSYSFDHTGYEDTHCSAYQVNMAIYTLPFYMTAYIMSDFGAISLWRNFKIDPVKTIDRYKGALSLGNTRTVPELYEAAGIKFDFSPAYVKELMDFPKEEIAALS